MYTSGTTGHPKGAKINHKMQLFNAINLSGLGGITSKTTQVVVLPLFHTGGLNCYANPVLHQGGQLIILRDFDPKITLMAINDKSLAISHLFAVPAPLQFMMQEPSFDKTDFSRLENVGVGGAPCAEIIIKKWQAKGIDVIQGWGMTETSPAGIFLAAEDSARKIGSAGKPVLHTEVKIVNETGTELKSHEVGEILIRGPNITPGYWKNEEATKKSLNEGWFKTGDLARFDEEGFIYIVDRQKDMYISGGENVYPAEVENVLYQLEEIAELAVIGVPDKRWGEVGKLFVVLKSEKNLDQNQIITHCLKNLAKFKVPAHIEFIDQLPRNATGKVLKRNLKERVIIKC
jgi:fatty-acyl-CoA synthase